MPIDGVTDAQPGLKAYLAAVAATPGPKSIVLPAGKYFIGLASTANQIALPSNTTIDASLAQFVFPTNLPTTNSAYPFPLAFSTVDATNLTWTGGSLLGYGFDVYTKDPSTNIWQPKETPGFLYFTSTTNHGCKNITIQNLFATNFSGPVVSINGVGSGDVYATTTTTVCSNLLLTNCVFENCGKFFWDYSYLLQIICYSNQYSAAQWWMATNYMSPGLIISPVTTTAGSSLVGFSNPGLVSLNTNSSATSHQCTFFGIVPSSIPQIVAGNPYFVVATNASGIAVSTAQGGSPVVFTGNSSGNLGLVPNIFAAGANMYLPYGQLVPPQSGAFYFADCLQVKVAGCTWSSSGDSSQFLRTANISVTGNTVNPSRMGGLFLASGCTNGIISNNVFNLGANGSRVITLETDVNISVVSNSFLGGGRGSLIVNPRQILIANNLFQTNTTKAYQNFAVGTIGPEYGGTWEQEYLFNIINNGQQITSIVITNNVFYTDSAFYFTRFNGFCFTNVIVAGNALYGTRVDGSDSTLGAVYAYPAAPPYAFNTTLYNSTIGNNIGLETASSGTFCTTLITPTNQVVIPHFLPNLWPSNGLYYWLSGIGFSRNSTTQNTNYQPTVSVVAPLSPSFSYSSIDGTNIYANFSSAIPSNTTVTINWSASQSIYFGNPDIENYINRLVNDGVQVNFSARNAIYGLLGPFNAVGWSRVLEIYPFYGTWPGALEKLKYSGTETQLRNLAGFVSGDYGIRGLTGDGLSKCLQTALTPNSMGNGLTGGMSVFVNNATSFQPNVGTYPIGIDDGVNVFGMRWTSGGLQGFYGGSTVSATVPIASLTSPTLYTVSRSSPTSLAIYTNGVLAAASSSLTASGVSTKNICLFSSTKSNNSGGNFWNGTLAFGFLDDGTLTAANYVYLNSAIRSYLAAINALP